VQDGTHHHNPERGVQGKEDIMDIPCRCGITGAGALPVSRSAVARYVRPLAFSVIAVACTTLAAPGAKAACFEDGIGCTNDHYIPKNQLSSLSCDALWTVRNTIYDERGYCFRTARAKDVFSNEDCHVRNAANLSFNKYERANIDRIVAVERVKGCR
jgi:hypothetical protein